MSEISNPDIFGNSVEDKKSTEVSIYADEIQVVEDFSTSERWIYMGAIYEKINDPILEDLINIRYKKDLPDWEKYFQKNDANIHWHEIKDSLDRKHIVNRWLKYIYDDCLISRKIYFSLLGINIDNLNTEEFDYNQNFNSIYNRFFRSMLGFSLKKFFGENVTVKNIFHEEGQQMYHEYFEWHPIFRLNQDKYLNFQCDKIEFLPKSHRDDKRSNIIQLCDTLLGIFKDLHLGIDAGSYPKYKKEILDSEFVQSFFIKRLIRQPDNLRSRFSYHKRFNLSLFPKRKSEIGSLERRMNNYYEISAIKLNYEENKNQNRLFD